MGVSGVGYEDYKSEDVILEYPVSSVLALIAFVVFIQVIFLNLATGLAIHDVKEITLHAEAEKNGIKTEHIYHTEKVLRIIEKLLHTISACCGIEERVNLLVLGRQKRFYTLHATQFAAMKGKLEH